MEALVRDEAAVSQLHGGLGCVGIQVDELLPWARVERSAGGRGQARGLQTPRPRRLNWTRAAEGTADPTGRQAQLTNTADEVVGAVGLPANDAQGLGHHEALLWREGLLSSGPRPARASSAGGRTPPTQRCGKPRPWRGKEQGQRRPGTGSDGLEWEEWRQEASRCAGMGKQQQQRG